MNDEVMELWKRYQNLQKSLIVLQADKDQLDKDLEDCGRRIRELYRISYNGLDGELKS